PLLRSWIQEPVPPATAYPERPGRWVGDDAWPSPATEWTERPLGGPAAPVRVRSPQQTGVDAGRFFPYGNATDLPPDQRAEDGRSVCFDGAPLERRTEILGRARVRLRMDSDSPRGNLVVRLCDVAPDGSSALVARGVLNLSSRFGRDRAVPWEPGTAEEVLVELGGTGYAFPAGHRIRVAVSTAYWPWVWPQPDDPEFTVWPDRSALLLPERAAGADDGRAPIAFAEPEQAPPLPVVFGEPGTGRSGGWCTTWAPASGRWRSTRTTAARAPTPTGSSTPSGPASTTGSGSTTRCRPWQAPSG